jgi:hypothetical protein
LPHVRREAGCVMSVPANAFCELTVVAVEGHARPCNGLAVATRTVRGKRVYVCALCAPCHDRGELRKDKPTPTGPRTPPPRGPGRRR